MSRMSMVESRVHQDSVLGLILYTLFINEIPEVIKDHEPTQTQLTSQMKMSR